MKLKKLWAYRNYTEGFQKRKRMKMLGNSWEFNSINFSLKTYAVKDSYVQTNNFHSWNFERSYYSEFYFWYKMDVFAWLLRGFLTEYEIKTSRADLKNDFKNCFVQINPKDPTTKKNWSYKHEEIEKRFTQSKQIFLHLFTKDLSSPRNS